MSKELRTGLIVGGILLAIMIFVPLVWGLTTGGQGTGWGGWGMMGPGMMGFGGLMMIPMVLFWGLIIFGLVWLFRGAAPGCGHYHAEHRENSDSAVDILKNRYARGEINREEFETKKRDLV